MSMIIFPSSPMTLSQAGGKAYSLYQLAHASFPIPDWFVVTPQALLEHLDEPTRAHIRSSHDMEEIDRIFAELKLSDDFINHLNRAMDQLGADENMLAVRSSAVDEDGAQHSFAGQLDSYLFVNHDAVAQKVVQVWRSGFSDRVRAYHEDSALAGELSIPAVLVQKMVDADRAGVAFGVDPVSGDADTCVVASVYGLGSALVSGEADADTFHVDPEGSVIKRELAEKTTAHRIDADSEEGVSSQPVEPSKSSLPSINDEHIRRIATLVRQCSAHYEKPQDIEWAIKGEKLYLLQSRPITSLESIDSGELNIWDNSNIAESYGGITTPLTFSFARRIYEEVYRQFCILLKVPRVRIEASTDVFARMLGLIRGRIYYNLLSWYRVLALLPGFAFNRSFMEQMMGVKEPLPQELVDEIGQASTGEKIQDVFRLINTIFGLIAQQWTLQKNIGRFYERLNDALSLTSAQMESMPADQLATHYRNLEEKLLTRWDAPLVNDFFAMIYYGVLQKLCQSWCQDEDATLQNDLLCGEGGMISTEPARRIRQMALQIVDNPALIETCTTGDLQQALNLMQERPDLLEDWRTYLEKFGDRCLDELKLESTTLNDDPVMLLQSIGHLAQRMSEAGVQKEENIEAQIRDKAEARVRKSLGIHIIRRMIFRWVLNNARARVRDRENLRFERTRLFGHVRRLFVEIGQRLHDSGHLEQARDIFFLEVNEVIGFIHGTTNTTRLPDLVAVRQAEFNSFQDMPSPADRFETRGTVHSGNDFISTIAPVTMDGESARGIGCCPGVVRGTVRVIVDPRGAQLKAGEILVAERTDPGWVMLFPAASGLLVERGSLLSHSAIVAREMGIPAVVSVSGLTQWLKTGDEVEFDGATGVIRVLERHDQ
ncbi:MAG: PEP-utilizing enzyme [Gammaproteobacteria bacterium]|nr:PEP-utilizing enzyme [Gammaproteobacteria bacterium]